MKTMDEYRLGVEALKKEAAPYLSRAGGISWMGRRIPDSEGNSEEYEWTCLTFTSSALAEVFYEKYREILVVDWSRWSNSVYVGTRYWNLKSAEHFRLRLRKLGYKI